MARYANMCTRLPKDALEERLRWVMPIINKEIKLKDAAMVFGGGKRTLERWVASYKKNGETGLIPRSTRPKSHPRETPIRIKEQIIALRAKTRLCARKINYKIKKENILIADRTIGKILKAEGLLRRYHPKKIRYKYIKLPLLSGELVEIDIKYVPENIEEKQYYQYTAIDCASRWRYLEAYDGMGNSETLDFLKKVMRVAHFRIRAIKTDNGACFTNRYTGYKKSADATNPRLHDLDLFCQEHGIIHYLIDPGKPAQNGKVERSHRTDQELFYDRNVFKNVADLKKKLRIWNNYYNNLEHCSLGGKTPNEMLALISN